MTIIILKRLRKLVFFSAIIVFACSSNLNSVGKTLLKFPIDENPITQYKKSKEFFSPVYVDHFPDEFDASSLIYSANFSNELGSISLYLIKKIPITNSLISNIYKISIASYSSIDSCLLIINKFASSERYIDIVLTNKEKMNLEKDNSINKYPIPNFFEFNYSDDNKILWQFEKNAKLSKCNLPIDYEIFVFEAKKGKFVDDSLLVKDTVMPKSWDHGLSKGVALSKEDSIIIYWLNIW